MSSNPKESFSITTAVVPDSLRFEDFGEKYLTYIDPNEHGNIEYAYRIAEAAHKGQFRQSGEPYLSHPLICTIYLIELGFRQPPFIKATLLHDVPEDSSKYLQEAERRLDEAINARLTASWEYPLGFEDGTDLIVRGFEIDTAEIVDAVTRRPIRTQNPRTKELEEKRYRRQVFDGPPGAWVVKGVDTIHNLRTLPSNNPGRIRRKIDETKRGYYPIFNMAEGTFPLEGGRLFRQIKQDIQKLEEGLQTS